ncbi:MAG: (2Fe-2S)-binding protein [Acidimicrobiia bacterium]|nr:MAG: (2Fe-2S)-binding protein [Acidimicrobiia bacterium]
MTDDTRVAVAFRVNGLAQRIEVDAGETLLRTLRDRLALTGTKEGCVEGECGACTVLVDGKPVDSCILATAAMEGREVLTIEGLSGSGELGLLQQAFVDHGAVQCGFCTPGFVMTLTALLEESSSPPPSEVREALAGNICRCTGYRQIIDAVAAVIAQGERP